MYDSVASGYFGIFRPDPAVSGWIFRLDPAVIGLWRWMTRRHVSRVFVSREEMRESPPYHWWIWIQLEPLCLWSDHEQEQPLEHF